MMPTYCVSATVEYAAWIYIEADTPEEAREAAEDIPPSSFERDSSTAMVTFNVSPEVELA